MTTIPMLGKEEEGERIREKHEKIRPPRYNEQIFWVCRLSIIYLVEDEPFIYILSSHTYTDKKIET